jgi:alpha-L-rhamnosidase
MRNSLKYTIMGLLALTQLEAKAQTSPLKKADWITAPDTSLTVPVFVRKIHIHQPIKSALLTITSHGIYEASINNSKVGQAYFMPGFTSYDHRLQYQEYNITKTLKVGNNQLNIIVAGGWYNGVFGGLMNHANYGHDKAVLLCLQLTFMDHSVQTIYSDHNWKIGTGAVQSSGFYEGEMQNTGLAVNKLQPVKLLAICKDNLVETNIPPVRQQESFRPKRIWKTAKDTFIVDFGQNLAGFVRLQIKGKAGDTVKIAHAEMLDQQGKFWTANLREAKAIDTYVLNGQSQLLEPHFTYHGFRYAKISGIAPTKVNCKAIAVYSQLKHTGTFSCSNPMLNQLQHNIVWSLNSNFVDIPTDCPQRSERLGWTGDAQIFCRTAAFNKNVDTFYKKYLADLKADQGVNGGLPNIVPDVYHHLDTLKGGVAGWGDASTIIPLTLYEVYGDKQVLEDQYTSMKAWVNYITKKAGTSHLWRSNGYGDWYALGDSTSLPLIDQAFYAHSTDILAKTAKLLNHRADAQQYNSLLIRIKFAFNQAYGAFDTKATSTQTAYTLALQFDLLSDSLRQATADQLAQKIKANDNHLATGFLGTAYLLPVLTRFGYTDLAYTLLLQQTYSSWLYPITKGATTIWERWDAIKPDGSLQQTSFNHYSYGAVGQWLYETVGGIQPASPGYKSIRIEPHPGGGLTWSKASYGCRYGLIRSEWHVKGKVTTFQITVPLNTTAEIALPNLSVKRVRAGNYVYQITNQ